MRISLTESVEVLVGGGEGVVFVEGADFSGALISCGDRTHLPLLGGAAGSLLLLLCQLPIVCMNTHTSTDRKTHIEMYIYTHIDTSHVYRQTYITKPRTLSGRRSMARRSSSRDLHFFITCSDVNTEETKWPHPHQDVCCMHCRIQK